jgi:hypothetical protein
MPLGADQRQQDVEPVVVEWEEVTEVFFFHPSSIYADIYISVKPQFWTANATPLPI